MPSTLTAAQWEALLRRIDTGNCTPFLGAGVNAGILPTGGKIARKWAQDNDYPLDDPADLARVAQFLAIDDPMAPKDKILAELDGALKEWLDGADVKKFLTADDQPLGVLADLPIPVYLTTNYDDLMVRALRLRKHNNKKKTPQRELCSWNRYIREQREGKSLFDSPGGYEPTPEAPVVFHLHGHNGLPQSLVLTECDYLDFLVNVTRDQQKVLPARIQQALAASSLLFIGYSLADWSFRVLLRGVVESIGSSQRRASVAVQLPPEVPFARREAVQKYLARYFGAIGNVTVSVEWCDAREFAAELREKWEKFKQ